MSIREYSKLQFKSVSSSKTTRDDSRSTKPSMILQMRKLWKIEDSVASSRPFDPVRVSAFKVKLEPQKWPAPIFPPPSSKRIPRDGCNGARNISPISPHGWPVLSIPSSRNALAWMFTAENRVRTVCLDFHRVKWPSASSFLFFFLFFFLLLFFELSTRRRRNERKTKKVCCGIVNFSCRRAYVRLIGFLCVSWIEFFSFANVILFIYVYLLYSV